MSTVPKPDWWIRLQNLLWYPKQLLPLTYVSNYGDAEGQKVCVWRMWFGRCFDIRTWLVERQLA